jgi:hypothetical protein
MKKRDFDDFDARMLCISIVLVYNLLLSVLHTHLPTYLPDNSIYLVSSLNSFVPVVLRTDRSVICLLSAAVATSVTVACIKLLHGRSMPDNRKLFSPSSS